MEGVGKGKGTERGEEGSPHFLLTTLTTGFSSLSNSSFVCSNSFVGTYWKRASAAVNHYNAENWNLSVTHVADTLCATSVNIM